MRVTLKGLPDKLRRAAWPSSVRGVSCPVKSGKFVGSKRKTLRESYARDIDMKYQVNIETSWIAGFWCADKGTRAKGVVAIVNTEESLLKTFRVYSLRNFDITRSKFRQRTICGYGESTELYFTRLPVRRFLEEFLLKRNIISRKNKFAYFAGLFDGDGNADGKSSTMCYFYSKKEKDLAIEDMKIIQELGFSASIEEAKKVVKLRILKPRFFASEILPYVRHPRKRKNISVLIRKRSYKS